MFDYNTHHNRCGHAEGTLAEYVENASRAGLKEIGLSDHSPIYHRGNDPHTLPKLAMSWGELDNYFSEATALQKEYAGKIVVRIGIESDYIPGWDDHFRRLWARNDMDYVIGSIHWVGDWHIYASKAMPEARTEGALLQDYVACLVGAARSGVFDIMGHLDGIKKWIHVSKDQVVSVYQDALQAVSAAGMALELNTSGWRKSEEEQYPSRPLLEEAYQLGIPITLGSDAHKPHLVGADFDRAIGILQEIGYSELATFENRQMRMVPIAAIS